MSHGYKTRADRLAFTMSQETLAQSEENIHNIQRLRDEVLNHKDTAIKNLQEEKQRPLIKHEKMESKSIHLETSHNSLAQ